MGKFGQRPTVLLSVEPGESLFDGFIDECQALGWRTVNVLHHANYFSANQFIAGLIADRWPNQTLMDKITESKIPIVDIRPRPDDDSLGEYSIQIDREAVFRMAADTFADRGFEHLAYIDFGKGALIGDTDLAAFKNQAGSRGSRVHICAIDSDGIDASTNSYSGAEQVARMIADWLSTRPKPLAIVTHNYRLAGRVMTACQMAGLAIPEEVALMTCGNRRIFCETAEVPLSAIDTNQTEIGRLAVRLLKLHWDGEDVPKKRILIPPVGLVERRSTDILAVRDPMVATAIRYIWDHLNCPLRVDDVANDVGVSRSTLERCFQKCIGRSVNAELRRKRMEECKKLLKSTDMSIPQITKAIGLTSRRYLHKSFKESFGMTPEKFRKSSKRPK